MIEGQVFRHGEVKLSGIEALKGTHNGETAIICCSGTSLSDYDDELAPRAWKRFAINEAVKKLGPAADYWVLADDPIAHEYGKHCNERTTVLCMHQATRIIRELCKSRTIHTVESMPKPGRYHNGFQFYSRATVMIGAVEMARYMGFKRFFIFGLDCFRLKERYYYDGRTPLSNAENEFREDQRVLSGITPGSRIYVTPRLKNMIEKLEIVRASGLWAGLEMWCVGSPNSQQKAIPKLSFEEFLRIASAAIPPASPTVPPPPPRICTVPPVRARGRPRKMPPLASPPVAEVDNRTMEIPFGDGFHGTVPCTTPQIARLQDESTEAELAELRRFAEPPEDPPETRTTT